MLKIETRNWQQGFILGALRSVPAFISILLLTSAAGATDPGLPTQEDLESLENRLVAVQGTEQLELLVEITERYNSISPPKALGFARQALDLLDTHPDPISRARVTHQMCWAYQNLGDYRTALDWCNQSASVAEAADDENALARASASPSLKPEFGPMSRCDWIGLATSISTQ